MNIYKLSLSVILLLTLSRSDAQSLAGLNIGVGLPFGDFADTDADNEDAGYAKTGIHIGIALDHPFSENIGITAAIQYGSNSLDENALDDFLSIATDLETQAYSQIGIFGGLLAQFPGEGATFKLRLMPGVVFSRSFGLEASQFGVVIKLDPVNTTSFGLKLGGGIDIPIVDNIAIMGNVDFMTYRAKYERDLDTNLGISFNNQDWQQATSLINISMGLGFKF